MTTRLRLPHGPKTGPLGLGFLDSFRADTLKTALRLKREFGDFVHVKAGPYHWFMFNHPDQVKDVLVTRAKIFGKTDIFKRVLKSVDGQGLIVSEGEFWLRQRRIINPAFSHTSIAEYARMMLDEVERHISQWEPGITVDLADEMTKLTLTVAARSFFSVDVSKRAKEIGDAVTIISRQMLTEFYELLPVPEWVPLPSKITKRRAVATIDQLIYDSIAAHSQNPNYAQDVLSRLMAARDIGHGGQGMTEQQIRDEAITLFNAGHDSTAAALSWAWYLLLKDSQAYEQLIKQSAEESQPAIALQIAKEALRLYPPAWVLPRQALEDTEIAGYSIPKKSLINVFPYVIHRDERFFPSPASFKPERFEEKNEQKIYPFAYFPFGAGPRICIGKDMALKEMQIVLSAISKKFRLEAAPDQQLIEPVPLISLEQKVGVKAIVRAL